MSDEFVLPVVGGEVAVVVPGDERIWRSRVEGSRGRTLNVAVPAGDAEPTRPAPGDPLVLAWVMHRNRFVAPVTFTGPTDADQPSWALELGDDVRTENWRRHVRGGGGEKLWFEATGEATGQAAGQAADERQVVGRVVDLSERGARCRVPDCRYAPGDGVNLHVDLNEQVVEAVGRLLHLRPVAGEEGIDAIIVYELDETASQSVRQYIFRRQLAERRAARDL